MEPGGSLQCSQEASTWFHKEPEESIPHRHILLT
jgi:hypothetical protein